jgi:hypothetical protein
MNNKTMIPATELHESTYALLMRSEEKERGILEIVVFALFIVCAVFSVWQFAGQSVAFPLRDIHFADSSAPAATGHCSEVRS